MASGHLKGQVAVNKRIGGMSDYKVIVRLGKIERETACDSSLHTIKKKSGLPENRWADAQILHEGKI